MKRLSIKVLNRNEIGTTASRRLRRSGLLPAVMYGRSGTRPLSVNAHQFGQLWKTTEGNVALVEIEDEKGVKSITLVQKPQVHPVTDYLVAIDFQEINEAEEFQAKVPVHILGEAIGVKTSGGVLDIVCHQLAVRCLLKHLPDAITLDVSELTVGQAIHIKDMPPMEGVSFVAAPNQVVVACTGASEEEEAAEETKVEAKPAKNAKPAAKTGGKK